MFFLILQKSLKESRVFCCKGSCKQGKGNIRLLFKTAFFPDTNLYIPLIIVISSMRQRAFTGHLLRNDVFADNRDVYRRILGQGEPYSEEYENALRQLEQFPPCIPHDRLAAHKVNVYEITEPRWQKFKGLLVPRGRLRRVFSADLGEMLKNECVEENEFISIGLHTDGQFAGYSAIIIADITPEKLFEFRFRQYVKINDVEIDDEKSTDIIRPMFSKSYAKAIPYAGKLIGFHYSRSSARIWGSKLYSGRLFPCTACRRQ